MKKKYDVADYPIHTVEKLRFRDTDSQGHLNNAVYITLIEMGRVEILFDPTYGLDHENSMFMLAHISIDYLVEVNWPGSVVIGTKVTHIGNSSFTTEQVVFSGEVCAAVAKTVIVWADKQTRQKKQLSDEAKAGLARLY